LQRGIEKNLKQVFGLPSDELSSPVRALAHFTRSQLYQWQNKEREATTDYKKARKLAPKDSMFPFQRGQSERKLGRCKNAAALLTEAVKLEPKNLIYLEKLADAQVCAGNTAGASATLKTALGRAPKAAALLLINGDNLRRMRKLNDAKKAYEAITLKEHGARAYTLANIGIAATYRSARKGSNAARHLENFMKKAPASVQNDKELQALLWHEMGRDHDSAGNQKKALFAFQTGVEQYRYYPDNHYFVAKLQRFRGSEAKESCKLYLTLAPRGQYAAECKKRGR